MQPCKYSTRSHHLPCPQPMLRSIYPVSRPFAPRACCGEAVSYSIIKERGGNSTCLQYRSSVLLLNECYPCSESHCGAWSLIRGCMSFRISILWDFLHTPFCRLFSIPWVSSRSQLILLNFTRFPAQEPSCSLVSLLLKDF